MELQEAIRNRRSHRLFKNLPVEQEKIVEILDAAHWAPSPANTQPWEFIVIRSSDARKRLYEFSEEAKRSGRIEVRGFSYVRPLPENIAGQSEEAEKLALEHYSLSFLKNVPVIIAIVGLPLTSVRSASYLETRDSYKYSCGAVIQNMLLTAQSLGLGSLWFTLFDQKPVGQFLRIDPGKHLVAMVMVGYPVISPPPPGRLPLAAKVKWVD